jgi:hypothetical protein
MGGSVLKNCRCVSKGEWNPTNDYRLHNGLLLVPVLSQINQFHTLML